MTFEPGTRLDRYEIRSLLGAGGMGEVYRARDPKLARDVAIKVLPSEFAADPERMRRFEQEAQVTGALNHPNILAVYDIAVQNGRPYLVSELLEGETLRSRMRVERLALRKTIEYALQIARGLSAAHGKGIIHRDLKPENVFITSDNRVKILDFGLAKLTTSLRETNAVDDLSTHTVLTAPGIALGTVSYMSPEQLRGKPVDHRTDIFSFGTLFYEMLTGKHPFFQGTTADTIQAILREDPPVIMDTTTVSPAYERLIRRCLEKDPVERFRSAGDLVYALEAISGISSGQSYSAVTPTTERKPGKKVGWFAAAMILILSIAGFVLFWPRHSQDRHVLRFSVSLPKNVVFVEDVETHNLIISPDAERIAFVAAEKSDRNIWVRSLSDMTPKKLPGTLDALSPFWSPDGRYLAFFAEGKLKKIDPSGGPSQTICNLPDTVDYFGEWRPDGSILFVEQGGSEMYRVPASGGKASLVKKFDQFWFFWIHFLPDGKHLLVTGTTNRLELQGIFLLNLETYETRLLSTALSRAEYMAPGFLIYANDGNLLAHPFDAKKLRFNGEPQIISEQFLSFDKTGWAEFSISKTGVITYLNDLLKTQPVWLDRNGRTIGNLSDQNLYRYLELSPDEKRVALQIMDNRTLSGDIWIHDIHRQTNNRIGFGSSDDGGAIWSPDGTRLAFFSCCEHESTLYIRGINDSGKGSPPLQPGFQWPLDWSNDGRFVLYNDDFDLWILPVSEGEKPYPLLKTPFKEDQARFSPDGSWIAYVSNESGQNDVYVARFANPGEKWRISAAGGASPRWRSDGKELFYVSADWKMMAVPVPVQPGAVFESGKPFVLFDLNPQTEYDVTADGERFLINTYAARTHSLPFNVIVNWTNLIQ